MNHESRIMNQEGTAKAPIKSFTQLYAWQEGHKLFVMVYGVTKNFPRTEQYTMTKQLRSAVHSITSNIAEGFSRRSYKEKIQFYAIALGSLTEVQNQIYGAKDIGYISIEDFQRMAVQSVTVNKLINGLIKKSKTMIPDS